MIYGTSHFVSRYDAIRYYAPYHYDDTTEAVDRKIAAGEIHIGRPELKRGERFFTKVSEGRYFIETLD